MNKDIEFIPLQLDENFREVIEQNRIILAMNAQIISAMLQAPMVVINNEVQEPSEE